MVTPHHHPLPVEGRPQPTRLRSVARAARKPPAPRTESAAHGRARRSSCAWRCGSLQPAPPAHRARLRSAGCAVCPSRRAHARAAPSVDRTARHARPALWARPDGSRPLRGAGGSSRRRALRYDGRAAAPPCSFAGGDGVWQAPDPHCGAAGATPRTVASPGVRMAVTRP